MSDTVPAHPRPPRFGGPAAKLGAALFLILLLQVPLLLVSGLISERQDRQQQVVNDISRSWGPAQTITGPTLAIPYDWTEPATPSSPARQRRNWIQVPTTSLTLTAALAPETRRRGLFHATVYTATVSMDGTVTIPALTARTAPGATFKWDEAVLALGASDLRGQRAGGTLALDGHSLPLTVVRLSGESSGLATAPAGLTAAPEPGTQLHVTAQLILRGTGSIGVLPWGEQIDLHVAAPWQSPSFSGAALPTAYDIGPDGFRASWDLTGDAAGASWREGPDPLPLYVFGADAPVTVELLEAVPTYQMVTRAAKYGTLFLVLAFLTYFLIEQGTGLRIHLAQYALLGLSVTMFALLLVSTAEPLGFNAGYALSTVAVMAQASLYTWSVTTRPRLAALLAAVLGAVFAILYVILRLETYALLAGTTTLFATLSVLMLTTRRLDWTGNTSRQPTLPA